VSARLAGGVAWGRRGVAIAAGLISAIGLSVFASGAGAAPQPNVNQVQARINQLTTQFDKVTTQLDQATQQLSAAQSKLTQVRTRLNHANAQFRTAQASVAAAAAAAFEATGATSIAGVLTSGDPAVVLQQGSLLMELSASRNAQTRQLLTDASQLTSVEQEMQRTEAGIAALKSKLASHKESLGKLIDTEKATLASLTVPQRQTVVNNSVGANGSSAPQQYTGPTTTQAGKAVAFAYAQLGKPYVWGATGPDSYDCSGLMYAAWQAAGITLPRTTTEEWAGLPHIPMSDLQPGDLILYNGESHVAMYVGDGYIIDAPHTGAVVEKLPESTSWYAAGVDGAVRP
jgi:peptidoglycan DL-endopeptidase CwlO